MGTAVGIINYYRILHMLLTENGDMPLTDIVVVGNWVETAETITRTLPVLSLLRCCQSSLCQLTRGDYITNSSLGRWHFVFVCSNVFIEFSLRANTVLIHCKRTMLIGVNGSWVFSSEWREGRLSHDDQNNNNNRHCL